MERRPRREPIALAGHSLGELSAQAAAMAARHDVSIANDNGPGRSSCQVRTRRSAPLSATRAPGIAALSHDQFWRTSDFATA